MPYIGNGKYQIKNNDTGETKTVDAGALHQFGLSPLKNPQEPNSQMAGGKIGQMAHDITTAIPDAIGGGYVRQLLGAAFEGSRALGNKLGVKNMYTNDKGQEMQDPFMSNQDLYNYSADNPGNAHPGLIGGKVAGETTINNIQNAMTLPTLLEGAGSVKSLFPSGLKERIAASGARMRSMQQAADAALDATENKQGVLTALKNKHINLEMERLPKDKQIAAGYHSILPSVTTGMKTELLRELEHEVTTGGGGQLGSLSLQGLQEAKEGAAKVGKFYKNNNSIKEEMYQNLSNAYGNIIKEAIPGIDKEYATQAKGYETLKKHGGGILNAMTHGVKKLPWPVQWYIYGQFENAVRGSEKTAGQTANDAANPNWGTYNPASYNSAGTQW